MSIATLERELVFWLRGIVKNPQLRLKDLCEWSSDEQTVRRHATPDETVVFVPQMGLWASVLSSAVKSKSAPANQPPRGGYAGAEQE